MNDWIDCGKGPDMHVWRRPTPQGGWLEVREDNRTKMVQAVDASGYVCIHVSVDAAIRYLET
jgi:hypothetical protein